MPFDVPDNQTECKSWQKNVEDFRVRPTSHVDVRTWRPMAGCADQAMGQANTHWLWRGATVQNGDQVADSLWMKAIECHQKMRRAQKIQHDSQMSRWKMESNITQKCYAGI